MFTKSQSVSGHSHFLLFCALLFACFWAFPVFAQEEESTEPEATAATSYVSDQLEITMRSGPSTRNKIVKMLTSGAALEILESDKNNGYSKVRLPNGTQGWVLSRFLVNQPVARDQLIDLQAQLQALEETNRQKQEELARLEFLRANIDRLQSENQTLTKELEEIRSTTANALSMSQENTDLQKAIDEVLADKERLLEENLQLKDEAGQKWFVRGAGVVLLGMLVGMIIPRIRWRQKRRWGEL